MEWSKETMPVEWSRGAESVEGGKGSRGRGGMRRSEIDLGDSKLQMWPFKCLLVDCSSLLVDFTSVLDKASDHLVLNNSA